MKDSESLSGHNSSVCPELICNGNRHRDLGSMIVKERKDDIVTVFDINDLYFIDLLVKSSLILSQLVHDLFRHLQILRYQILKIFLCAGSLTEKE